MKTLIITAFAVMFCLHSFATGHIEKKDRSKKVLSTQPVKPKKAAAKKDYCATESDWYMNSWGIFTASCTRCTASMALASVMARNCAFQRAMFLSSQFGYAGEH